MTRKLRASPSRESKPVIVRVSEVRPRQVQFLWNGRVPLGKLTLLEGDPGLGKSLVTLDLAARVSSGRSMPDGSPGIKGGVLILSAEDGPGDTIRPRLEVAGADLERVLLFTAVAQPGGGERLPEFPDDTEALRTIIEENQVVLLVMDPFVAYLASYVNSWRDQDVRRMLHPLAKLAEETDVAAIAIRHLAKTLGRQAVYRGGGSIGIVGAARSALLVAKDPDNDKQRVLAVVKSNLAAPAASLTYRIEEAENGVARVVWEGESRHTADSLVATIDAGPGRSALENAVEFLIWKLADGPRPEKEIEDAAHGSGISERTLKRARQAAGVKSRRVGGFGKTGYWMLELPKGATQVLDECGPLSTSGAVEQRGSVEVPAGLAPARSADEV